MKLVDFEAIKRRIADKQTPTQIAAEYPHVLYDAIVSYWSKWWQEHELESLRAFRRSKAKKSTCIKKFHAGDTPLYELARQLDMSPCALARDLLKERGFESTQIKEIMKRPEAIMNMVDKDGITIIKPRTTMNNSNSNTNNSADSTLIQIPLDKWTKEIQLCLANDQHNNPYLDSIKHHTGQEYESLLESHLASHHLPFQNENDLRADGRASKTPDFLLSVPILVHDHVVNWIDSKAQFADPELKRDHLDKQLRGYVNRYGSGMVIYWLDYVEEDKPTSSTISSHSSSSTTPPSNSFRGGPRLASHSFDDDKQILLVTDFPSEFTTMDQLLLKELQPRVTIPSTFNSDATTNVTTTSTPSIVQEHINASTTTDPHTIELAQSLLEIKEINQTSLTPPVTKIKPPN